MEKGEQLLEEEVEESSWRKEIRNKKEGEEMRGNKRKSARINSDKGKRGMGIIRGMTGLPDMEIGRK